jgi:hypothetical protein
MTIRYRPLLLLFSVLLASCQAQRAAFQFQPKAPIAVSAEVTATRTEELPPSHQPIVLVQKAAPAENRAPHARAVQHLLQHLPGRPSTRPTLPVLGRSEAPRQQAHQLLRKRAAPVLAGVAEAGLGTMFLGILGLLALLIGLVGMLFAGGGFFGFLALGGLVALLISILVPYLTGG